MYFSLTEFQHLVHQAYEQVAANAPQHLKTAVGAIVQNPETGVKCVVSIIPSLLNPPFDPFQQGLCKLFVQELSEHTIFTPLDERTVNSLEVNDKSCLLIDPFSGQGKINIYSGWVSLLLAKKLLEQEQQTQQTASEMQKQQPLFGQADAEQPNTAPYTQEQLGFISAIGTDFEFDVQGTETEEQATASTSQMPPLATKGTKRSAATLPAATPAKRIAIQPQYITPTATVASAAASQTLEELEPLQPFDHRSVIAPQQKLTLAPQMTPEAPLPSTSQGASSNPEVNSNTRKKKNHQCKYCGNTFTRSQSLVNHIRIHTGEKPYKCLVCHASFSQEIALTTHSRKHTGERPYKCDWEGCDMKFYRSDHLKVHNNTHTGAKPYRCDNCGNTFPSSGNLKRHQKKCSQ